MSTSTERGNVAKRALLSSAIRSMNGRQLDSHLALARTQGVDVDVYEASQKDDPTWIALFGEIACKMKNGSCDYQKVSSQLCDFAEATLHRPPVLSDLDGFLVELIIRRLQAVTTDTRRGKLIANDLRARMNYFRQLDEIATARFKRPPIDFDAIPIFRRSTFNDLPVNPKGAQVPVYEVPKGWDRKLLAITLVEAFEVYRRERLVGCSEVTAKHMCHAIRVYDRFLGRPSLVGDLNQSKVLDWIEWRLGSGDVARRSVQSELERLLAMWRWAASKRWLPDFPTIKPIKYPDRIPDAWTDEELEALLKAARAMDGTLKGSMENVPCRLFFPAMISFFNDTGERAGAVMQVRFEDIDAQGWITIRAEYRKGQPRDIRRKLRPETLAWITELRSLTDAKTVKRVFEWPYHPNYIYKFFDRILIAAGLPVNRRTKFHKLRRTAASDFEANGGNASRLLDHNNRATTLKYLDPRVIKELQPADIVPGIGESKVAAKADQDSELMRKIRELIGTGVVS